MKLNEIIDPAEAKVLLRAKRKQRSARLVDIAKAYKKNIETVLEKKLYFFRGSDNHRPLSDDDTELMWYEQPARTVPRNSVFGNGNWLMSWVESTWEDYPKRSMSYFASQSHMSAENFGRADQTLLIIPADSVNSFGVMETDFNEASQEAQTLMAAISGMLGSCQKIIAKESTPLLMKLNRQVFLHRGINLNDDTKPTASTVKLYIAALDELLDNLFQIQQHMTETVKRVHPNSLMPNPETVLVTVLKSFRSELKELGYASVEEYAQTLTPKAMGATHYTKFGQIKSSPSKDDELWFEGSYLGVYWHDEDDVREGLEALLDELNFSELDQARRKSDH